MAAFHGEQILSDELQHDLQGMEEEAGTLVAFLKDANAQLQSAHDAEHSYPATAGALAAPFLQVFHQASVECGRRQGLLSVSFHRAYSTAQRVCAAADKAAQEMESGTPQAQLLWQIEFQIKILLDKIATGQRGARLDTKEQQQAKRQQPAHYRLFQVEPIWARAMQLGIPGVPKWDGERQTAAEVVYQLQELAACVRAVAAPASSGSETNVQPKRVLTTPVCARD